MADFDSLVLGIVFSAIFFYVLSGVVRAAVRDGMLEAHARTQGAEDDITDPMQQPSQ
jgi:hypothetical protein